MKFKIVFNLTDGDCICGISTPEKTYEVITIGGDSYYRCKAFDDQKNTFLIPMNSVKYIKCIEMDWLK